MCILRQREEEQQVMIKKLREKSGETLVEVLASMFIFLILFGILQGAVSYSHASMQKNKQIREENTDHSGACFCTESRWRK